MGNFNGHFVGYGQLEAWAEAVSMLEPVYASLISESNTGDYGIRYERAVILCAQPQGEIVHYCRIPVASIEWIADQPLTQNHEQRIERAEQAKKIVRDWLRAQGFVVREAAVAFPRDFRLLEGGAGFLQYNQKRGYTLAETEGLHRDPAARPA